MDRPTPPKPAKPPREDQLAQALKANLRRRKAAAKPAVRPVAKPAEG